jgi:hypothetical protein
MKLWKITAADLTSLILKWVQYFKFFYSLINIALDLERVIQGAETDYRARRG